MRIGFVTLPAPGHLNPMTTLARKLQDRGHEIVFFGLPDSEPQVRAAGLPFFPCCQEEYPPGAWDKQMRDLSLLTGEAALEMTVKIICRSCRAFIRFGPAAIKQSEVDAMAVDSVARGFQCVAMTEKIPFVSISNALHADLSGNTPIWIFDWLPDAGPAARTRNLQGLAAFNKFLAPLTEIQKAYLQQAGVAVDWSDPYALLSQRAWITQVPKEFDFPSDTWPKQFHHTGPFHDDSGRAPADFPWERLTGEPLIYASMGTLQNGSEGVFHVIANAACAPGRQLVLSIGPNLNIDQFGLLPANTIVVNRAPQLELLKRAALCITHAGLNTVLESLAQGVPMVAIPVTNDQPGVAARVVYSGAGLMISLKNLTAESLRVLVDQVLNTTSFQENSRRLQAAIEQAKGLDLAATLIERALGASVATTSSKLLGVRLDQNRSGFVDFRS